MLKHESNHIYITLINPYIPIYETQQINIPMKYITCPSLVAWALASGDERRSPEVYDLKRRLGLPGRRLRGLLQCARFFFSGGVVLWAMVSEIFGAVDAETTCWNTWKTWQEHMICGRKAEKQKGIVVGDGFFCTVPSLLLFIIYIIIYCNLVYASIAAHVFSSNGAPTSKRTGRRLKKPLVLYMFGFYIATSSFRISM